MKTIYESNSSLGCFLQCPRKYKYKYIDKLQSAGYSSSLGFGTFVHAFIEQFNGGNLNAAVTAYDREKARCQPEWHEQIEHDYLLAQQVTRLWKTFWDGYDGHLSNRAFEFTDTEAEWRYQAGPREILVGKRDGLIKHKDFHKNFLHEVKTSGDVDKETYKLKLQLDRQISANITALNKTGVDCDGVVYDIVWKPRLVRKVDRKTMPDETLADFRERIINEVTANPIKYFERLLVYRSPNDFAEYNTDLTAQFAMLEFSERVGYPRSQGACENFGRLCEFFSGCMDNKEELFDSFERREIKLPEISKEFQQGIESKEVQPVYTGESKATSTKLPFQN